MARSYTTVFFDLDGTLLPMDTDVFMKRYFKALGTFAAENGLDSDMCLGAVMAGVKAMAKSDGSATNHDVFWEAFTKATGFDAEEMKTLVLAFLRGTIFPGRRRCAGKPRGRAHRGDAQKEGLSRGGDHHAHVPACGPCMSAFAGRALTPTISSSPPITRPAMP